MPLKLIECVLPWLVGSLSEEAARSFLQNMYMEGSVLIVTLNFLLVFITVFYVLCATCFILSVANRHSHLLQLQHQIRP